MKSKIAAAALLALFVAAPARADGDARPGASTADDSAPPGGIRYYSDLGPDRVDVSAYPEEQRRNYAIYALACARCHGLARSINAPYASRGWWEFYVTSMRARGSVAKRPFAREEVKAVLDFLDYDSRIRKVRDAAAFEKSTAELKTRFDAYVDKRMDDLQNGAQPRLLPGEPPKP